MSNHKVFPLFHSISFFLVSLFLVGCGSGGGGSAKDPDPTPITISVSGVEGGVVLKSVSTNEEWTITENGEISVGAFVSGSDIEISVTPS